MTNSRSPEGDWKRLSKAVERRRNVLKLTQGDIAAQGGPSTGTLRNLVNRAKRMSGPMLRRLEQALSWPEGHAEQILDGGSEDAPLPLLESPNPGKIVLYFDPSLIAMLTSQDLIHVQLTAQDVANAEMKRLLDRRPGTGAHEGDGA